MPDPIVVEVNNKTLEAIPVFRLPKPWMPRDVAESLIVDESLEARAERSEWERSKRYG